jgi:environmental stress-induced protein Ves
MERVIKKDQFREMPWKNGLGSTQEIDIVPSHTDFTKGDFQWRLSSAVIKTANTFSPFPGYDRLLIVLSGQGLELNGSVLRPLSVHAFSGEDTVECALVDGDVVDMGIIYKRDQYRCDMQVVTVNQTTKIFFGDGVHYIKSISGGITLDGITLNTEEILKIEGSEIVDIEVATNPQHFLRISVYLK